MAQSLAPVYQQSRKIEIPAQVATSRALTVVTLPVGAPVAHHAVNSSPTPDFLEARLHQKEKECIDLKRELERAVQNIVRLHHELDRAGQVRAHAESVAVTQRREHEKVVSGV